METAAEWHTEYRNVEVCYGLLHVPVEVMRLSR